MASDESYRDPTNLQGKLQKHQAFEAELTANAGRVDSVEKVCTVYLTLCDWLCKKRSKSCSRFPSLMSHNPECA